MRVCLLVLFFCGWVVAARDDLRGADGDFDLHEGLVYSDAGLEMDLYIPMGSVAAVPCVLVIQGGGFRGQSGEGFKPFAAHLAENGFAAALVAYRGRPDHRYLDTVGDLKAAVRFVRKVSADYGISSERIGAMGRSAGATLAALLAVTGGVEGFEGAGGHLEQSSRIQAMVGISGVYDFVSRFTSEAQIALQPRLDAKLMSNGEWIGAPFSSASEQWREASAVNHIDSEDPPMLLLHSRNDETVPWIQSVDMSEAMTKRGGRARIHISETGGHRGPDEAMDLMVAFFREIFGGE